MISYDIVVQCHAIIAQLEYLNGHIRTLKQLRSSNRRANLGGLANS